MTLLAPDTALETTGVSCVDRAMAYLENRDEWITRVRFDPAKRWYEKIAADEHHEIWLLSWLPGESTGFHDHFRSWGAFAVAMGTLQEREHTSLGTIVRAVTTGGSRSFAPGYIHDVRNTSSAPAVSIHVYSPTLDGMNRYEVHAGHPTVVSTEHSCDW